MKLRVSIILISILFLLACEEEQQEQYVSLEKIEIDSLYAVKLPSFLSAHYDMHDYASLQYYDADSMFYVMVIDDPKERLGEVRRKRLRLNSYYQYVKKTAFEPADSTALITEGNLFFKGGEGQYGDYFVKVDYFEKKYKLFYRIIAFESPTHFFHMVIWMPFESHDNRQAWVDSITHSFAVIPQPLPPAEQDTARMDSGITEE